MRLRDTGAKKQCPPHQWKALHDTPGDGCLYATRICDECKRREHAIITSDVLASTPRTLWHLADVGWVAV